MEQTKALNALEVRLQTIYLIETLITNDALALPCSIKVSHFASCCRRLGRSSHFRSQHVRLRRAAADAAHPGAGVLERPLFTLHPAPDLLIRHIRDLQVHTKTSSSLRRPDPQVAPTYPAFIGERPVKTFIQRTAKCFGTIFNTRNRDTHHYGHICWSTRCYVGSCPSSGPGHQRRTTARSLTRVCTSHDCGFGQLVRSLYEYPL